MRHEGMNVSQSLQKCVIDTYVYQILYAIDTYRY